MQLVWLGNVANLPVAKKNGREMTLHHNYRLRTTRAITATVVLLALGGCAGGISSDFSYSSKDANSLVLIEQPQGTLSFPDGSMSPNFLLLTPVDLSAGKPSGKSHQIILHVDNQLRAAPPDSSSGSRTSGFAKARLAPGDYALSEIRGPGGYNTMGYYCLLAHAPVVRIAPNAISVIDLSQILGLGDTLRKNSSLKQESVERARLALEQYPNIDAEASLAPIVDVVRFKESSAVGFMRSSFCDSTTGFEPIG